jgi:hypothetical protein
MCRAIGVTATGVRGARMNEFICSILDNPAMVEACNNLVARLTQGAGVGIPTALLIYFFFFPERFEKASSILYKWLRFLGANFKKRYIKHDLQSRVAAFVKELSSQAPGLETKQLAVNWVDKNTDRESFLEEGKVVLRLREDDPHDMNFAHGAYLFVSTSLLFRAKRYLSKPQKTAVDLFVTTKLIEREKPSIRTYFLEDYLHPHMHDPESKAAQLYDQFAIIDRGGFFFPMLLQELDFLGRRVFGGRKDDLIINEVYGLAEFLVGLSEREVGSIGDLEFEREYCKTAIMIIGKSFKLDHSIEPYVKYIRDALADKDMDTIYLIGRAENSSKMDEIYEAVNDIFDAAGKRTSKGVLHYGEREEQREQYIIALVRKGTQLYYVSR